MPKQSSMIASAGSELMNGTSGIGAIRSTTATRISTPFRKLTARPPVSTSRRGRTRCSKRSAQPRTRASTLRTVGAGRLWFSSRCGSQGTRLSITENPIRSIGSPSTVLIPGTVTGSRKGAARTPQNTRSPCSPSAASISRSVTAGSFTSASAEASAADIRTSGFRNWMPVTCRAWLRW